MRAEPAITPSRLWTSPDPSASVHEWRWTSGPRAFISCASADGAEPADRLDRELRHHGVATWRHVRDINQARDFTVQLEIAIETATIVIVCLTLAAVEEGSFVRKEIVYAQLRDKPIAVARFVPIPPPISVVTNTPFEFYEDWEATFLRLLAFCRTEATVTPL